MNQKLRELLQEVVSKNFECQKSTFEQILKIQSQISTEDFKNEIEVYVPENMRAEFASRVSVCMQCAT